MSERCMSALNTLRKFSTATLHTLSYPFSLVYSLSLSSLVSTLTMHADHRMAQVGADPNATMSDATAKYDTITNAGHEMVAFAKEFVDLESKDPAEMMKKQAVLHFFLTSYLGVQYVKQAFVLLDEITTVYGCEPSHRYYDPFTNYFAVRGKCGRQVEQTLNITSDSLHGL